MKSVIKMRGNKKELNEIFPLCWTCSSIYLSVRRKRIQVLPLYYFILAIFLSFVSVFCISSKALKHQVLHNLYALIFLCITTNDIYVNAAKSFNTLLIGKKYSLTLVIISSSKIKQTKKLYAKRYSFLSYFNLQKRTYLLLRLTNRLYSSCYFSHKM